MRRREFIGALGGATAWPLVSRAQQPAMPVIGFVNSATPGAYPPVSAFLEGLAETDLVEGQDVVIEYRWAHGRYDLLPALVTDLIQRKVNIIAATSTPAAMAAKAATSGLPIVFTTSGDPVRLGLVTSLVKPGGNLTGTTQLNVEVAAKRLELMHEAIPAITKIALLTNPPGPLAEPVSQEVQLAAPTFGLELEVVHASSEQELDAVFKSLTQLHAEALVIGSDAFFSSYGSELGGLSVQYRLPAIYQYPQFTAAGGLISYGGNVAESYRLAGVYVGRILKGAKPADLPVQQVTKVELILNLKTAKTLGITLPMSLLARADAVIE
jgi:putative tryptophan/tyrosine transport system substrate-binding protein